MPTSSQVLSCRYHYDPLDRLTGASPMGRASIHRFYQQSRLTTEIQGALQRTLVQHKDQLLAQQQRMNTSVKTTLLVTDQQRSILQLLGASGVESLAYQPYGHHPAENGLLSLLGFNGEQRDPITGHYILGNGYRAFNPVLMRFNSPDSLSPFGEGGLNAYGYCDGDPVNNMDPTGRIKIPKLPWVGGGRSVSFASPPRVPRFTKQVNPVFSGHDLPEITDVEGFFRRLEGVPSSGLRPTSPAASTSASTSSSVSAVAGSSSSSALGASTPPTLTRLELRRLSSQLTKRRVSNRWDGSLLIRKGDSVNRYRDILVDERIASRLAHHYRSGFRYERSIRNQAQIKLAQSQLETKFRNKYNQSIRDAL